MKSEINVSMFWRVFARSWKKIVALVIVAMLLMGLYTNFLMNKKYSSSVTFYVINVSADYDYVTASLMTVIEHLSKDYIQIISSEMLMSPLSEILRNEYGIEYSPDQIKSMISTSVTADTSTFSLKVTNADPNHAYIIAQLIANEAPRVVKNFTDHSYVEEEIEEEVQEPTVEGEEGTGEAQQPEVIEPKEPKLEKIRVLNSPRLDGTPDSPNLISNMVVAGFVVAVVAYAAYFMKDLFNTVISTEEDIAEITVKYPILGSLPRWE